MTNDFARTVRSSAAGTAVAPKVSIVEEPSTKEVLASELVVEEVT